MAGIPDCHTGGERGGRLLIVSYTEYMDDNEEYIHIISAPEVTRRERRQYGER